MLCERFHTTLAKDSQFINRMKKTTLFVLILVLSICASAQDNKTQSAPFKIMINGQEQGPYKLEQLKPMIQNGQLTRNTMVWQEGMASWTEAEQVPEINELFKSVPSVQVQSLTDTMKIKQEKPVKVKNAYYYKKRGRINMSIGAGLFVLGGVFGLLNINSDPVYLYVYGGIAAIGVIEFSIGLSQRIHAKNLDKQEKKITISPARTGIGIAINF